MTTHPTVPYQNSYTPHLPLLTYQNDYTPHLPLPKQLHTPPTLTKTATHPSYPYLHIKMTTHPTYPYQHSYTPHLPLPKQLHTPPTLTSMPESPRVDRLVSSASPRLLGWTGVGEMLGLVCGESDMLPASDAGNDVACDTRTSSTSMWFYDTPHKAMHTWWCLPTGALNLTWRVYCCNVKSLMLLHEHSAALHELSVKTLLQHWHNHSHGVTLT